MKKRELTIAYEFSTLYIEGDPHRDGDIEVAKIPFDNLWNFILSNKAGGDSDIVMSVHTRGGKRYIRTGRYVGTIQTKDGHIIEILPKIYKESEQHKEDSDLCRKVFLNMLRHFTDVNAKSFQNASLNTKSGFPILEVYINNYINAVEQLIVGGLKKNYALVEENQKYLKGKLDINKQITKNVANKAVFAIKYNKYIEDIPQNRIVVSTLRKLMMDSHSTTNKAHISALLTLMADIPSSSNIENDLKLACTSNRLFASYELLLKWSSQFLLNKGFTTFSGSFVNQSLLFQADKLFEDFIAFLFRKYAASYTISTQNTRYFLVEKHNGRSMFQLRPDIVVENNKNNFNYNCVIIDTKWKAIDSQKPNSTYLIDIKDMYQLYAYGQKYKHGQTGELGYEVIPKLVLLYPYSEKFTTALPEFIYEEIKEKFGLKLMVVPFDLADPMTYEKQVYEIIHCLDVKPEIQPIYKYNYDLKNETIPLIAAEDTLTYNKSKKMLVGCYKDEEHLNWIKNNHLYNIRLGNREGAIDKSGIIISASKLLLYNVDNPKDYRLFDLDESKQIIANYEFMHKKGYPGLEPDREYLLYVIEGIAPITPGFEVEKLKEQFAPDLKIKGAPFYVSL
jgi:5-methylcytosine-specific restriction enzyme subunit McrC